MAGGSLNLQFNQIIIVSSGGSIPPFGTKTPRPIENKIVGTRSKNFAGGSLVVIVINVSPIFIP